MEKVQVVKQWAKTAVDRENIAKNSNLQTLCLLEAWREQQLKVVVALVL